jgi:hypothetical protein
MSAFDSAAAVVDSDIETYYSDNDSGVWLELVNHPDYEIYSEYPHDIRKKDTGKLVAKYIHQGTGYWRVCLNSKPYQLHRLIAEQFINNPNPARYICVDHINRNRTDYHIDNLRWTNQSENCKNKTSHKGVMYKYVDEIAGDSIVVDRYGNKTLEHYYYDDNLDQFYWHDAELNKYRELPYISLKNGSRYVWAYETNGNRVAILIHKFKQLYNLE